MNATTAPNLLLVGFMGSGKSSVGRLLATRLGFRFVDTDAMVVKTAGMPITKIFEKHGEAAFRKMETEALASLVGKKSLIVATGGGIVTVEENLPLLRQIGVVAGLTAKESVIFERVSRNTRRPLLKTANPRQTIADLLSRRLPLYQAAADFQVDTTTKSHAEVAGEVIEAARKQIPWHD